LIEVYAAGVEAVRPKVSAAFGIDQLHVHPELIADSADTAFKDVANPTQRRRRSAALPMTRRRL
jgi:hypothetical protein